MIDQILLILFAIAATGAWIGAQYVAQQGAEALDGGSQCERSQRSMGLCDHGDGTFCMDVRN
jgi:hypothetical protein